MCFFCKGDLKQSNTIYTVSINDCIIIIKNVPCMECQQCGEKYFDDDVMIKLENIIERVKNVVSEVTVVDYNKQVA